MIVTLSVGTFHYRKRQLSRRFPLSESLYKGENEKQIRRGGLPLYTEKPAQNIMLACFCFLFASLVAAAAIAVLFSSTPFLMPGLLLMSMVFVMIGRQRVHRFAIEQQKFVKQVRLVALLSAVFCGVSAMLNSINAALV